MNFNDEHNELLIAQGEAHLIPGHIPGGFLAGFQSSADAEMGCGQRSVVVLLLTMVLVPPLAGFYSYFYGRPSAPARVQQGDRQGLGTCGRFRASRWFRARPIL